jgi:hypothetical protein
MDMPNRKFYERQIYASHIGGAYSQPAYPVNDITFGTFLWSNLPSGEDTKVAWISDSPDGTCASGTGGTGIKVWCFWDGTAWKPIGNLSSPTFTSPHLGAAQALSLSVTGVLDGHDAVFKDMTTPVAVGSSYLREYHFNQNATANQAIIYNLPVAAAGKKYCFFNSNNGSAPDTGTLRLNTSSLSQSVIDPNGGISMGGGYIISGAGAGNAGCVEGLDDYHWQFYSYKGTWTAH